MTVAIHMPIHTVSETNQREHWRKRHGRRKQQREVAVVMTHTAGPFELPAVVHMVRVAPRSLDSDNLLGALKGVRDGIADALGVDDNDGRVTWTYDQRKGEPRQYAVEVTIGPPVDRIADLEARVVKLEQMHGVMSW